MSDHPASPMTQIVIGTLGLVGIAAGYWGFLVAREQGVPPEVREMPGRVRGVVIGVHDAPGRVVATGAPTTVKVSTVEYLVDGQRYPVDAGGDRGVGTHVFVAYKPSDPSHARAYHDDAGWKKLVAILCLAVGLLCIAVIATGVWRIVRPAT